MKYKALLLWLSLVQIACAQEVASCWPDSGSDDEFSDSRKLFETIEELVLWGHVSESLPQIPFSESKQEAEEMLEIKSASTDKPVFNTNSTPTHKIISSQVKSAFKAYPRIATQSDKVDYSPLITKIDTSIDNKIAQTGGICCCPGTVFKTRKQVVEHFAATHLCNGEFLCPYPVCSHAYISDRQLIADHYITTHYVPTLYCCINATCRKNHKTRSALIAHVKKCNKR